MLSPSPKPRLVTIVGGGLAGLTLGIALRQRNVPVQLFEAGKYPRHRVCGEFISGSGQQTLKNLGLMEQLRDAIPATTAAFYSGGKTLRKTLPEPAICISRFDLDDLLAREFSRLEGKLVSNSRWKGTFEAGVIRASGRRVHSSTQGWRYFGLKVHAQNVNLEADLEMHFQTNAYVGLCRLPGNRVNVCGLFRSHTAIPDLHRHWRQLLMGPQGFALNDRLQKADVDNDSFCSVAGLSLVPYSGLKQQECSVGDSLTMIPPVTGNGMSMAFESAELAVDPLAKYSRGEISWTEASEAIARRCDRAFRSRLMWARRLQTALFYPRIRFFLLSCAARFPSLWDASFRLTR